MSFKMAGTEHRKTWGGGGGTKYGAIFDLAIHDSLKNYRQYRKRIPELM